MAATREYTRCVRLCELSTFLTWGVTFTREIVTFTCLFAQFVWFCFPKALLPFVILSDIIDGFHDGVRACPCFCQQLEVNISLSAS